MFVRIIAMSDNTFIPENVLTLSLFLYDFDSSNLNVVKMENIYMVVVSQLIFFIFLRKSIIEHTTSKNIMMDITVRADMFQTEYYYEMRLGVLTPTREKGKFAYQKTEPKAYCRSWAEQVLLKHIPLMKVWLVDSEGLNKLDVPSTKQNWFMGYAMHYQQNPNLLKPRPESV